MAGLKEIKRRIRSVKNTKKITYAMKLVSAAKLRKAQEAVGRARQYTDALNNLLLELGSEQGLSEILHPLMEKRRAIKRIGLLVIGGSRGLCGAYNTNVYRRIESVLREKAPAGDFSTFDAVLVGKKPAEYYRRLRRSYIKSYEELSEDANQWPIHQICTGVEELFLSGKVDEVYMIYTRFKSALSQTAMCERLLPLADVEISSQKGGPSRGGGVTVFEPSPAEVFSAIIPRILRSRVRQAALDSKASEHGSRMTAMDSATKNSGDLIYKLTLSYNRLRQGKITSELLDIIGGAEAQA